MNSITKAAIVLLPMLITSGCVTTEAYQSAAPDSLQRANAACIAAMHEGFDAGVIVYITPESPDGHAVIWVDDRRGEKSSQEPNIRYYDPTRKMYLEGISGPVTWISRGPSLAWWAAKESHATDIWALVAAK